MQATMTSTKIPKLTHIKVQNHKCPEVFISKPGDSMLFQRVWTTPSVGKLWLDKVWATFVDLRPVNV